MKLVVTLKVLIFVISFVTITYSKENSSDLNAASIFRKHVCLDYEVNCPYVDIKTVVPQNQTCCKNLTQIFECSYRHNMQLMRYLNLLKSWNCSDQLQTECSLKTFNFNELSEKMYLSVCDLAKFNETCKTQNSGNSTSSKSSYIFSDKPDVIKDPCTSVKEFYSFGPETFVEIFSFDHSLCPVVWCAIQSENIRNVSSWDCAHQRSVFRFYLQLEK